MGALCLAALACAFIERGDDILTFLRNPGLLSALAAEGGAAGDLSSGGDLGLAMYRNPRTRDKVVDFYTDLTGSEEIAGVITEVAAKYDVPFSLAFALAWRESKFSPVAVNFDDGSTDRGLYQLNSLAFPDLRESDFFDPRQSAERGLSYLSLCLKNGGNEIVGLAMYNAGMSRVLQDGTPRSTLDYISTVIRYQDEMNAQLEAAVVRNEKVDPSFLADSVGTSS